MSAIIKINAIALEHQDVVRPMSVLRAEGKGLGLKGKKLTDYVEKAFNGSVTQRNIALAGLTETAKANGFVLDSASLNKSGDKLTAVLVKPKSSPAPKITPELVADDLGIDLEAFKAFLAKAQAERKAKDGTGAVVDLDAIGE